jgi:uncharacterized glyoxalase superfamily protein PhnB
MHMTSTMPVTGAIPTIFTTLRYADARKAIQWLQDAFGLEAGAVYPPEGPTVDHAVMFHGVGGIMLGSDQDNAYPLGTAKLAPGTGMYMIVDDVDAHYATAIAAGASIEIDLYDTGYGTREYTARDFEGHLWSFGNYRPERPSAS